MSKNRFGITDTLDVIEGQNPLYGIVPGLIGTAKTEQKPAKVKAETKQENTENV